MTPIYYFDGEGVDTIIRSIKVEFLTTYLGAGKNAGLAARGQVKHSKGWFTGWFFLDKKDAQEALKTALNGTISLKMNKIAELQEEIAALTKRRDSFR